MLFVINDDLQQISIWNQISVQWWDLTINVSCKSEKIAQQTCLVHSCLLWWQLFLDCIRVYPFASHREFTSVDALNLSDFSNNSRNCSVSRWLWTLNKNDRNHHSCLIILKRLTTLNVQDANMSLNITCIRLKQNPKLNVCDWYTTPEWWK